MAPTLQDHDRLIVNKLVYELGELDFVGHCSGFPAAVRRQLHDLLPPLQSERAVTTMRSDRGELP